MCVRLICGIEAGSSGLNWFYDHPTEIEVWWSFY